jgi:hypothetical protein
MRIVKNGSKAVKDNGKKGGLVKGRFLDKSLHTEGNNSNKEENQRPADSRASSFPRFSACSLSGIKCWR